MSSIVRFQEDNGKCYSSILHDDGSYSFVSISQQGVLIKKTKWGILGKRLYVNKDRHLTAHLAHMFDKIVENHETGINNVVLATFTKIALSCSSANHIPDKFDSLWKESRMYRGSIQYIGAPSDNTSE